MGNCFTRNTPEETTTTQVANIEVLLGAQGWRQHPSQKIEVLQNSSQVSAFRLDADHVYVQLRLNGVVLPTPTYERLMKHLTSRRYKPISLYPTSIPDFLFLRAITDKPNSLVIDLDGSRDKLLPSAAKVFLGDFAVCVVPEGVAFLRASVEDVILVRWSEKVVSVGVSYCSDDQHGVVVSLVDKGVFRLCFKQVGVDTETLNAQQVSRRLMLSSEHNYVSFLQPIEDRGPETCDLYGQLRASSHQFEPRWHRVPGSGTEAVWWVRETPSDKVIVLRYEKSVYVVGLAAGSTKRACVFVTGSGAVE